MSAALSGIAHPPPVARPFAGAHEHLLAELDLLRQGLHLETLRLRSRGQLVESDFRGLYVADEYVDALLKDSSDSAHGETPAALDDLQRRLEARLRATSAEGRILPLFRLADRFDLSAFERQVLVACAATEIDLTFEVLFSYVQNDVNRKRPTTNLLLRLLAPPAERLHLRQAFSLSEKLQRNDLIVPVEDAQSKDGSMLARAWRTDNRITAFLLGQTEIDSRLQPFATLVAEPKALPLLLPEPLRQRLEKLVDRDAMVILRGPDGSGRRTIAAAVSARQDRPLLQADLSRATLPAPEALRLLVREACLQEANLFLANAGSLCSEKNHANSSSLFTDLEQFHGSQNRTLFLGADAEFNVPVASALLLDLPVPSFEDRAALWRMALAATPPAVQDVDPMALASKYALTGGRIHAACRTAAAAGTFSAQELDAAIRAQSSNGLGRLAQRVESQHGWQDLVLPPRALQQIRAAHASYRFRHIVYSQWGFDQRVAMGKGLNVLFCGPSGTGKTMAAGILAKELSLDLFKIDLSSIVSKYIGETEKQLSLVFREAQTSNAVLFFDEADALFGKRSEVKDAHDRYANVETAHLLQKMEEYEGIVILTTNFRKNIDDAFARRMHHVVEFALPDAALRLRIWQGLIPSQAQITGDVDFGFLSRQFDFSGGNIRNVVLAAAFLAAEEGSPIQMKHFILGTARELQKLGKLPSRSDFKEYFDVLHGHV